MPRLLIPAPWRNRAVYAAVLLGVIALGLASRHPGLLPWPLAKWSGSILWAAMIYLLISIAAPGAARNIRLIVALAIAVALEFSRLYPVAWLDEVRRSTAGTLLLGRIFSPWNLLAYAIGIGAAGLADRWWIRHGSQGSVSTGPMTSAAHSAGRFETRPGKAAVR